MSLRRYCGMAVWFPSVLAPPSAGNPGSGRSDPAPEARPHLRYVTEAHGPALPVIRSCDKAAVCACRRRRNPVPMYQACRPEQLSSRGNWRDKDGSRQDPV